MTDFYFLDFENTNEIIAFDELARFGNFGLDRDPEPSSTVLDGDGGIVNECCTNPCTFRTLQSYCEL